MASVRSVVLAVTLALSTSACLEKCAPGQVGPGVARLTARNLGGVIQLINADTVCGFESDRAKYDFTIDAREGQQGCATWTVRDCDLDYTQREHVSYDCGQVSTAIRGRVVVDATRTICGTITGDDKQPVVPVGPDGVTIVLDRVEFDGFEVVSSSMDAKMTWKEGSISAVARPRLAASTEEGICMVPTPHIAMTEVHYKDALVHVVAEGRSFDVPVASSNLTLVNGQHSGQENVLSGDIEVWGGTVDVADGDGLDPEYDPSRFLEGYACEEGLALPVSFECKNIAPVLAQGAARLTIRSIGTIASVTEADERCGFSSVYVLENAEILQGAVGELGVMRFTVDRCDIELAKNSIAQTSCSGIETIASGNFTVSAHKIMRGRLTGNLTEPVVPMDDHPVEIVLEAVELDGFVVSSNNQTLTQTTGTLAARVTPRVAMDTSVGACAFPSPIARISDVEIGESAVVIDVPQGRFETTLEGGRLTAVNGSWNDETNVLDGTISLLGETFALPTNPADDGLDPEYDDARFASEWMCGNVDRVAPFECEFAAPLAQGVASLTAMTLGRVASLLELDTNCGFSSDPVLDGAAIAGTLGDPGGTAEFRVTSPCALTFATPTEVDEDCHGTKTFVVGTVRATGHKTLRGYVSGDRLQPIVPTSWEPADIDLELEFDDFAVWTEPGENRLDIFSGTLTGSVRPRTAIDTTNGACAKPTPVALLDDMRYDAAELRVTSEGRAFDLSVSASDLLAINGRRGERENIIEGTIIVDGQAFTIPIDAEEGLDPAYDPTTFVEGFTCDAELEVPDSDAACNMMKPLGEGAARLLIAAVGAATHMVNLDDSCGYDDIFVLADPSRVEGDPGDIGLMEWELDECVPSYGSPYTVDCLGRQSYADGRVTHTGKRTVVGIREDLIVADSIVPNTPNSVTVTHDELVFEEFEIMDIDPGETAPRRSVKIHSGTLSAVVEPITGRNPDGGFDVRTSVARLRDIVAGVVPMTIFFDGKTFNVRVDAANLEAFNGSWEGSPDTNMITGQIVVEGQMIDLPPQGLDPDFEQADFDARYVCIDGLQETVPPSNVPSP